ncbi:hypothetical protein [Haladaptatus litoreus]|nr:hypothetical protein [Haladaptatus litoreus]
MSDKSEQEVKVKRDDYDEIEKLGTKFLFVILGVALLGVWSFEYQSLAGMPQTVLPAVALALLAAGGVDVALGRLRK